MSPSMGFTLFEVLVAITIVGVVLLGAAGAVAVVADTRLEVTAVGLETTSRSNSERQLVEWLTNLRLTEGAEIALLGTPKTATFQTRCRRPGGWTSPCDLELTLQGEPPELIASVGDGSTVRLDLSNVLRFLYLANPDRGGSWAPGWQSIVAPLALGLETESGVIVLPVGVQP